jgi:hypothetical protein
MKSIIFHSILYTFSTFIYFLFFIVIDTINTNNFNIENNMFIYLLIAINFTFNVALLDHKQNKKVEL